MRDLTEFEKWQIVGAPKAGSSVTKTIELLDFSRATISRTMTEFKKHGKLFSNWGNSVRTSKLTDSDRRALKRIVGRRHRTTSTKVNAELNQHLKSPVSTKTVRRELINARYHGCLIVTASSQTIMLPYIPLMSLIIGMKSVKVS